MTDVHKEVNATLRELSRLVLLEYGEVAVRTPRNKRIREIAQRLCQGDPDIVTTGIPGNPCKAGKDAIAIVHPIQPAWMTYWQEAEAALDVVEGEH